MNIDKLVEELRDGSRTARDKLIEHHIPLAKHLAFKYARRYGTDSEELVSIAFMSLVHNVDRIMRGEALKGKNNIGGFLNSHIVFSLRDYYKKRQGHMEEGISYNSAVYNLKLEELKRVAKNDIEKRIIEDLIKGEKINSTVFSLGITHNRYYVIRHQLKKRFIEESI